jgi:hypothetical protein
MDQDLLLMHPGACVWRVTATISKTSNRTATIIATSTVQEEGVAGLEEAEVAEVELKVRGAPETRHRAVVKLKRTLLWHLRWVRELQQHLLRLKYRQLFTPRHLRF